MDALRQACGLRPQHLIADVGCGPGLLAEIFLDNGNRVIGVEPNREMRLAGEAISGGLRQFQHGGRQRRGHQAARCERRLRRRRPSISLVSAARNARRIRAHPETGRLGGSDLARPRYRIHAISAGYEAFFRSYSIDYEQVTHKYLASYDALQRFFAPNAVKLIQQHNQQRLDFDGLRGRMLSSSYIPKSGERHEAMMQELPQLFSAHAEDDHVVLEYDTKIYYGHLDR